MLSFKPAFSLYSFTFIKRLFSSYSLSATRVVSSAYLKLLIFLLAILIPACDSSSPAFPMMYSAYKLNKMVCYSHVLKNFPQDMGIPDHFTCLLRNAGLDEAQTGIKIARRNIINLIYADDITLMAESEEELKMK